jgi:hypothetical protein
MPGRRWYVVAALVFVVGLVAFAGFLFFRLRDLDEGFRQVVVPGSSDIVLDEPGTWTIYRETGSSVGGKYYGYADLTGLEVVVRTPSGETVTLTAPGVNENYTIGGREGVAIFRFEAPAPGVYQLEARYPAGREGSEGVLAVGRMFMTNLLITIFGGIGIAMTSFTLALVIAVVTFVRRYRAKRRLASPPVVYPPA